MIELVVFLYSSFYFLVNSIASLDIFCSALEESSTNCINDISEFTKQIFQLIINFFYILYNSSLC
jgi:hypothetical protein